MFILNVCALVYVSLCVLESATNTVRFDGLFAGGMIKQQHPSALFVLPGRCRPLFIRNSESNLFL